MSRRIVTRIASMLIIAAAGCGASESENLSTRATDDPARLEAAQAEAEAARQQARTAEAGAVGDALSGVEDP